MRFQVSFVILILFSTYFCVQVHATGYYFSNFCKSGIGNLTIYPTSSGEGSSGFIRESLPQSTYANGLDCTLLLKPPSGYGITLIVELIDLRMNTYLICLDTITIQGSTGTSSYGPWYDKLSSTCMQYLRPEYSNSGPMRINFKTGHGSASPIGLPNTFYITYSTYYQGGNVGAIAGGIVGAIVVVVIVVTIVFICRRRAVVVRSTTTVCAPPTTTVYPQQTYANPQSPPYGYNQQNVPQQTNYYTQPQP